MSEPPSVVFVAQAGTCVKVSGFLFSIQKLQIKALQFMHLSFFV